MIIKNISNEKGAPKVVGIGSYWIMPGDEKAIPDEECYTAERDHFGAPTGNTVIVPGILAQEKIGMITFTETRKAAAAQAAAFADAHADDGADRKLTAAEKRAATRAANAAKAQEQTAV